MIETKYFCDLCGTEMKHADYKDWDERPNRFLRIEKFPSRVCIGDRAHGTLNTRTYVLCEKCLNRMTKYMFSKEESE